MLDLYDSTGRFKTPVKAFRTHGSEFLIYVTDFVKIKWEDLYVHRVCILNTPPTKDIKEQLQRLLVLNGYTNYFLTEVLV